MGAAGASVCAHGCVRACACVRAISARLRLCSCMGGRLQHLCAWVLVQVCTMGAKHATHCRLPPHHANPPLPRTHCGSLRKAPATMVSFTWACTESEVSSTAHTPPCAYCVHPSLAASLVTMATVP